MENKKKSGLGGSEQMDSFPVPFRRKKEVRVLGVLGKRCLCVLRSIYLVEIGCLTKQLWAGHTLGQLASFYGGAC